MPHFFSESSNNNQQISVNYDGTSVTLSLSEPPYNSELKIKPMDSDALTMSVSSVNAEKINKFMRSPEIKDPKELTKLLDACKLTNISALVRNHTEHYVVESSEANSPRTNMRGT